MEGRSCRWRCVNPGLQEPIPCAVQNHMDILCLPSQAGHSSSCYKEKPSVKEVEGIHTVRALKGVPGTFLLCASSAPGLAAERQPQCSEGFAGEEMLQIEETFQRLGPGGGMDYSYRWELLALGFRNTRGLE